VSGRQKSKRRRKRRIAGAAVQQAPAPEPGKSKADIAREQLVPLEKGQRPLAVTIGALIAGGLGLSTVVLFAAGVDTGSGDGRSPATLVYAGLMLFMAQGMWRARYWAVLGFQALLALLILVWSLLLVRAESLLAVIVAVFVVGSAGTLFWFLVKALARIQMPERRQHAGDQ
jgi:hypothetical protein